MFYLISISLWQEFCDFFYFSGFISSNIPDKELWELDFVVNVLGYLFLAWHS